MRPRRVIMDVLGSRRYGVSFSHALTALSQAGQRDPKFLGRLLEHAPIPIRRNGAPRWAVSRSTISVRRRRPVFVN